MDPNFALAQARLNTSSILDDLDHEHATNPDHVQQLAENFQSLDEWLSRDGFLPTDWDKEEYKPSARAEDMPMGRVLSLAIFCINTFMHPDASSDEDVAVLEARSDEVIEGLVELRNIYDATRKV